MTRTKGNLGSISGWEILTERCVIVTIYLFVFNKRNQILEMLLSGKTSVDLTKRFVVVKTSECCLTIINSVKIGTVRLDPGVLLVLYPGTDIDQKQVQEAI